MHEKPASCTLADSVSDDTAAREPRREGKLPPCRDTARHPTRGRASEHCGADGARPKPVFDQAKTRRVRVRLPSWRHILGGILGGLNLFYMGELNLLGGRRQPHARHDCCYLGLSLRTEVLDDGFQRLPASDLRLRRIRV